MNLRKNKGEEAEVAAEAMNDIMFFLMLFFLIISTLANPNVVKLSVPNSQAKKELSKKEPLSLIVEKNGKDVLYILGTTPVPKSMLEARLAANLKDIKDPIVAVNAADELTIQDLVDVLSLGEKMHIKMVFASRKI